jgi:hypothetical protein
MGEVGKPSPSAGFFGRGWETIAQRSFFLFRCFSTALLLRILLLSRSAGAGAKTRLKKRTQTNKIEPHVISSSRRDDRD